MSCCCHCDCWECRKRELMAEMARLQTLQTKVEAKIRLLRKLAKTKPSKGDK